MNILPILVLFVTAQAAPKPAGQSDGIIAKVVGGTKASIGEAPYIVSLRDATNEHFCAGSIITPRWIVTAAHCSEEVTYIVAGIDKLSQKGQRYNVSTVVVNPDYNPATVANDIALVYLAQNISYRAFVKPISLATEVIGETTLKLTGWGLTSYPGNSSNTLQKLSVKTLLNTNCAEKLKEPSECLPYDSQICTLNQVGQGACFGDSGGPLVTQSGKLAAIVSWGEPCAIGYADVHTRISYFAEWINNTIVTSPVI